VIEVSGAAEGVLELDSGACLADVLKPDASLVGGAKETALSCNRVKNRYIIQGFARWMFGVVDSCYGGLQRDQKSEEKEKIFDGT
jgi:hypothetical protein